MEKKDLSFRRGILDSSLGTTLEVASLNRQEIVFLLTKTENGSPEQVKLRQIHDNYVYIISCLTSADEMGGGLDRVIEEFTNL